MNFEVKKSKVMIHLLKGPLYRDSSASVWHDLLSFEDEIKEYFSHIGLLLFVHKDFGFAFLKQEVSTEEIASQRVPFGEISSEMVSEEQSLPRLVQQRELSFELSVLLAVLRKRLAEHDGLSGDPRLVLDEKDILQMLKIFLPETNNDVKQKKEVDALIEKAIDMGVLRRMTHDSRKLEVLRILAALFDASRLSELNDRLMEYESYAQQST